MSLAQPPVTIVRVVPEATRQLGVIDVLLQAIGLTGLILLGSLLLGGILGGLFIWYRIRRPVNSLTGEGDGVCRLNLS
jgi:hypothetical protein